MPQPRKANRSTGRKPLGGANWKHAALIVGLISTVVAIDTWGIQWYQSPWSFEALGPTLTGTWEGSLQARQGAQYRVFLDLQYRHQGRRLRRGESNLTGRGWICSRQGEVYEYELQGDASRSGDTVSVGLTSPDRSKSGLGTTPVGAWSTPLLTLRPTNNPFQADGTFAPNRARTGMDPDDSFMPTELRKGDRVSFLAACGRLAG